MKNRKPLQLFILLVLTSIITSSTMVSYSKENRTNETLKNPNISSDCTFRGKKLYGKIQFVNNFPDIKVQFVDAFPDLNIKIVNAFPDQCGKWQIVNAFPDLKVQIVTAFPDIKVKYVEAFPGLSK